MSQDRPTLSEVGEENVRSYKQFQRMMKLAPTDEEDPCNGVPCNECHIGGCPRDGSDYDDLFYGDD